MPLIEPGDNLSSILIEAIESQNLCIEDGDIFAVAQKIFSKAENRYLNLEDLVASDEAISLSEKVNKDPKFIQAILNESSQVVRYRMGVLIVEHKLGFIHANAGIDRSNIDQSSNKVLLLPENPDASASALRLKLSDHFKKDIGLLMTDTMGRPFRNGIVGFSIGSSNIECILDERGKVDLYDNKLKVTQIGVADELAAAASLIMGQANQKKPVILIRGYKSLVGSAEQSCDLIRSEDEDLFR